MRARVRTPVDTGEFVSPYQGRWLAARTNALRFWARVLWGRRA